MFWPFSLLGLINVGMWENNCDIFLAFRHWKNKVLDLWWSGWIYMPTSFITLSIPLQYRFITGQFFGFLWRIWFSYLNHMKGHIGPEKM